MPATNKERTLRTRDPRSGGAYMVDGRGNTWRSRAPGPHAHGDAARQVLDGLRTEVWGQQKPSNDPRHIQHSPGTPTAGLCERGNDTGKSTGRSGRQKAATRRNMRREERVTVQGPGKKPQPDGMSHGGGGGGAHGSEAQATLCVPQIGLQLRGPVISFIDLLKERCLMWGVGPGGHRRKNEECLVRGASCRPPRRCTTVLRVSRARLRGCRAERWFLRTGSVRR